MVDGARGRVLYISYDGLLEPLGESQVVGYVERLASGYDMTVISFEKRHDALDAPRVAAMSERLERAGVRWRRLRYHKRPPVISTAFDVGRAVLQAMGTRSGTPEIVHARGTVAALMALPLQRWRGSRLVFDLRGFWADERADRGHWSRRSLVYRMAKRWERRFFEAADAVVSLTQDSKAAFADLGCRPRPGVPIVVVSTCVNLRSFSPGPKDSGLIRRLGLGGGRVVGCIGTLDDYYARHETLRCLAALLRGLPGSRALVVTRQDHAALRRDAASAGVDPDRLAMSAAPFSEIPAHVRLFDLGLVFNKACLSKRAAAPTKVGEFLASGVPILVNDGGGDVAGIVRETRAGLVLPAAAPEAVEAALPRIRALMDDPGVPSRCRASAERYFALDDGVAAYAALYASLVPPHAETPAPMMAEVTP